MVSGSVCDKLLRVLQVPDGLAAVGLGRQAEVDLFFPSGTETLFT